MAVFAVYLKGRDEPILIDADSEDHARSYFYFTHASADHLAGVVPADKIRQPIKHG
jgi:hypothetical protein